MQRRTLLQNACLLSGCAFLATPALQAAPLPTAERDATLSYIASLRNEDGGFRATVAPGPSALSNTVPALRTYQHLGVPVPRPRRTLRFVLACHDSVSGGFGDTPGGKPDVRSTAMGLMALAELRRVQGADTKAVKAAEKYLVEQAKTPAEIYIAVAGLDAYKSAVAVPDAWAKVFTDMRKPDGSYGAGSADTATAVITLLRLGKALPDSAATVGKHITDGQHPYGGFKGMNGEADLSTTYRMVRACYMLKVQPNQDRLRLFIGRCRNADGGYGSTPGAPSAANTTYYAAIVLDWAEQLGP
jgi:prenyltransferase beta subunit